MLQASGARLENFQIACTDENHTGCGAALGQVLQACSTTLKTVKLMRNWGVPFDAACLRELVPGLVSCCDTLELLWGPWSVFSALPATCPTFPRLTELYLEGGDGSAVDLASPAWDIMASGRLPALASLIIVGAKGEGAGRLSRALEGVAGTLTRLILTSFPGDGLPAGACYELGAAIGKLRRLSHLKLELPSGGRDCAAVGRGMAASGGCPELSAVGVWGVKKNLDWLTQEPSLIVPSVRKLILLEVCGTEEEALLLCCGLVQMGYKHRLYALLTDTDDKVFPL
jgi:hypothetical protein